MNRFFSWQYTFFELNLFVIVSDDSQSIVFGRIIILLLFFQIVNSKREKNEKSVPVSPRVD